MKRNVVFTLENSQNQTIIVSDLKELCDKMLPIGFSPDDDLEDRYMVRKIPATNIILALKPTSYWSTAQKEYKQHYFVFDSDEELYEWLLESYKS